MTPSCPRCGQSSITEAAVCDSCRAADRAAAATQTLRLFAPAPTQLPGQTGLDLDPR